MNEIEFELLDDKEEFDFSLDVGIKDVYPPLENITITPNKENQIFKSKNYYGFDEIKIEKVTALADENIKPENIKRDVEILGVKGELEVIDYWSVEKSEMYTSTLFDFKYYLKVLPKKLDISYTTFVYNLLEDTLIEKADLSEWIFNSSITSLQRWFYDCTELEYVNLSCINFTNITNMYGLFYNTGRNKEELVIEFGESFDTSNVTNMSAMFQQSKIKSIPELNAEKVTNIYGFVNSVSTLTDFGGLKDIGKAYDTTKSENYTSYKLDFSSCRYLTHDSLLNIINGLYDLTSIGVKAQQLVLGTRNLTKLSDEEKLIVQNKGWNLS